MNYITKKDLLKCYRDGILVPAQDGKQWTQHRLNPHLPKQFHLSQTPFVIFWPNWNIFQTRSYQLSHRIHLSSDGIMTQPLSEAHILTKVNCPKSPQTEHTHPQFQDVCGLSSKTLCSSPSVCSSSSHLHAQRTQFGNLFHNAKQPVQLVLLPNTH